MKLIKTLYFGLTEEGIWTSFKSREPVRNCKRASEIVGKKVVKFKTAPLFYQIFRFYCR